MSTMQRMTLIGLYNYEQTFDVDLFKNLALPDGYDKPTFINSLLLEHGEKCVLYTDPDFFMQAIGMWSSKYSLELSRIHEALTAEYNPIWNYDRYEDWSDEGTGKTSSETQGDRTNTSETAAGRKNTSETDSNRKDVSETGAKHEGESTTNAGHKAQDQQNYDDLTTNDYDVTTSNITDGTIEHEVSADNSGTYQPEWKETTDLGSRKTENDGTISKHVEGTTQNLVESTNSKTAEESKDNSKTVNSGADNSKTVESSVDNSKTVDTGADNSKTVGTSADKSKHSGHLWGNIGVTTSAQMVTEVVEQRFKISLYGTATKMFANELLIGIW